MFCITTIFWDVRFRQDRVSFYSTRASPAPAVFSIMACVSCFCGKVSFRFAERTPRWCLECGCCDCRQAREYCANVLAKQNEVASIIPFPVPGQHSSAEHSALSQLAYFANDVILPELPGRNDNDAPPPNDNALLRLAKLRETGRSVRLLARCCKAILAVDHPGYGGRVVMVPLQSCRATPSSSCPPFARLYMKDWDRIEAAEGPPPPVLPGVMVTRGDEADEAELERKREVVRNRFREAEVTMPRQGVSLQEWFERLGDVEVWGLEEGKRF